MEFETILFDKRDGIATLTLNRPEKLNAINRLMNKELATAWTNIKRDPKVIAVVVTGAGDRALCSGYDLGEFATRTNRRPLRPKLTAIQNKCWKPVITAVNGLVTARGLQFVVDSDIVICAEHASFFDSYVRVGMTGVDEALVMMRRIPFESTFRMFFVGRDDRMDAQRALALGLVGEVVPREKLMDRAMELARSLLQNSPGAMATTKRAMWESLDYGIQDGLKAAHRIADPWLKATKDSREGTKAFLEKRKPNWEPLVPARSSRSKRRTKRS